VVAEHGGRRLERAAAVKLADQQVMQFAKPTPRRQRVRRKQWRFNSYRQVCVATMRDLFAPARLYLPSRSSGQSPASSLGAKTVDFTAAGGDSDRCHRGAVDRSKSHRGAGPSRIRPCSAAYTTVHRAVIHGGCFDMVSAVRRRGVGPGKRGVRVWRERCPQGPVASWNPAHWKTLTRW